MKPHFGTRQTPTDAGGETQASSLPNLSASGSPSASTPAPPVRVNYLHALRAAIMAIVNRTHSLELRASADKEMLDSMLRADLGLIAQEANTASDPSAERCADFVREAKSIMEGTPREKLAEALTELEGRIHLAQANTTYAA